MFWSLSEVHTYTVKLMPKIEPLEKFCPVTKVPKILFPLSRCFTTARIDFLGLIDLLNVGC